MFFPTRPPFPTAIRRRRRSQQPSVDAAVRNSHPSTLPLPSAITPATAAAIRDHQATAAVAAIRPSISATSLPVSTASAAASHHRVSRCRSQSPPALPPTLLSMRTQRYTLHGHWLQTSTGTGRLSMEELNLQMLTITRSMLRDFFVPTQENWLFLTADYSQIELRLMAHFSKDSSLIELLSNPHGDVFTMIAARWTGKSESIVSSKQRDQTKRLVYGILYGMGSKSLAEQLGCSSDEAIEKIQSFKGSFPGVASWLQEAVCICREKGKEKSKAQRQAVNSICQGSAADIIKIAMISVHSAIVKDIPKSRSNSSLLKTLTCLKGDAESSYRTLLICSSELTESFVFRFTMNLSLKLMGSWNVAPYKHGKCSIPSCTPSRQTDDWKNMGIFGAFPR
nr:helicase and polymerase-containing protein TEBICHI isoform X1 [Ipomoea batatas]